MQGICFSYAKGVIITKKTSAAFSAYRMIFLKGTVQWKARCFGTRCASCDTLS